jgi:hypothetical protein
VLPFGIIDAAAVPRPAASHGRGHQHAVRRYVPSSLRLKPPLPPARSTSGVRFASSGDRSLRTNSEIAAMARTIPIVTLVRSVLMLVVSLASPLTQADEPGAVRVEIRDGRSFRGKVDDRSNDERLWLRNQCGGAVLTRPITWMAIDKVVAGDKSFTADEFRASYSTWSSAAPTGSCDSPPSNAPRPSPALMQTPAPPQRVTSIQVDAQLANWDNDVEHDGVFVTVVPLDANGEVVAVSGSVEIDLIGEGPGTTARLSTFPSLGRWVKSIRADEVTANGARMRIEFLAAHPEFDLRLSPYGLVHVRFVAAGHGTFEATSYLTTLRPYNPMRDRLQQQTQQRFFSQEQTGIGKRPTAPVNGL